MWIWRENHFVTWVVNVGVVFPTPSLSGFCAFCDDLEVDSVFTAVKEHDRSSPCPTTVSLFCPMTSLALLGWSPQIVCLAWTFLWGKKNHHHFQMTSWHLWGTTTWNKRKGFLVGERFSKKHTHFPQQIGGGSWHVRVSCFEGSFQYWSPFLQDEISMKQYFHDFSCLAWFWALISLMGLRKAIRYVDLSYNQLTTVPTALMQASRPLPEFLGIFGQGQTTFFFFDFSGLACKNIPTMPGYFFGIHSDLSDLKHFFFRPKS